VSIDAEPLSVLDGMSQTATSVGGFAESSVVQGFVTGAFGDSLVTSSDTSVEAGEPAAELANVLRHLVPGLPYVTFTSSGAEANEKALALCRAVSPRPAASKVLVFDGCFHGRTLLTLHCTANPAKRKRFELSGYLATFVPFPVWSEPGEEPRAPSGYYAMAGTGDVAALEARHGDPDDDPLLAAEVEALVAVDAALRSGEHFAVIVEPMQAEGGDRYATARFFRALRLLTRHHDTPLVFDEVQTGFALGGDFAWHLGFRLVNLRGQPDYPDAVTFAKRAQVGVVMSRFEDPEPSSTHPASLIRGRMHADMVATQHSAERIENLVRSRLAALARGFPHLVAHPRGKGYAFAFDLPTPELLEAFVGQRFWRGAIVFAAGSRTARYRLNEGYLAREVDLLFDAIRRQLAWLDAHPGKKPPAWEDPVVVERIRKVAPHRIRTVPGREAEALLPAMLDIELRVYEPARRTPQKDIEAALRDPESIVTIAEVDDGGAWRFAGFAIGWPLERAAAYDEGPDGDPMLGKHNTMYSMSLTLAPEYHDSGLGRFIKQAQLEEAARRRTADGAPRYRYVTGRNRIGHTPRMTHLNWVFGAHTVSVLTGQYEDPEGQAVYYRIPLTPIAPLPRELLPGPSAGVPAPRRSRNSGAIPLPAFDLAQGLARPLHRPPASLLEAEQGGLLFGPAVNKLTLMNYVTPAVVRALEWASALMPRLPHMYLTSSRDECVDKALRVIKYHRGDGQIAIGFAGGYVGHTTAAARSLSDPATHRQGPAHFRWPLVPHPADVGVEASIAAIRAAVEAAGGPGRVLGLVYEIVQERSGRVMPDAMWPALAALQGELSLPLIAIETATACFRSGLGALASGALPLTPDILAWWGGAQTGYLHVASRWRVAEPLTLVSTWDGDELSLIREHHQLRAARHLDVGRAAAALDRALAPARGAGMAVRGLGLYRVLDAGERAAVVADELRRRGVVVRRFASGCLGVVPALDQAEDAALRLGAALREVL
jgi:RHH-type transcriptional regulator, proline utilization regulon repressor / proline dehydrogenase / delta 1-pyrroline-5-carboxylate dehydrogenase